MSTTRLTDLAKIILQNATAVENHLNEQKHPLPSFDENGPTELALTPAMRQAQQKTMEAAIELQDLLTGPANLLRPTLNGASLNAIYAFKIASSVPLNGKITFADLSKKVGLKVADLSRIVRFAISHHRVFHEPEPGFVAHTAASRLLAEDPNAMAGLGFMFEECYQSFAHTTEVLKTHQDPAPHQSGWAIGMSSNESMWDYYQTHPELGQRTAQAMAAFTKGSGHDLDAVYDGYDWSSLNDKKGLLVDIGGADGELAIGLARKHPDIRCIVQDVPGVIEKFKDNIPTDVSDRVRLEPHNFLQTQPVKADMYLFRQIFHNWSETSSIEILRNLIPVLEPGIKILVNDAILPPPGVLPLLQERAVRSIDMIMMSLFNAREREKKDWEALFAAADARFQNVKAWSHEASSLGLIEATWTG